MVELESLVLVRDPLEHSCIQEGVTCYCYNSVAVCNVASFESNPAILFLFSVEVRKYLALSQGTRNIFRAPHPAV